MSTNKEKITRNLFNLEQTLVNILIQLEKDNIDVAEKMINNLEIHNRLLKSKLFSLKSEKSFDDIKKHYLDVFKTLS